METITYPPDVDKEYLSSFEEDARQIPPDYVEWLDSLPASEEPVEFDKPF